MIHQKKSTVQFSHLSVSKEVNYVFGFSTLGEFSVLTIHLSVSCLHIFMFFCVCVCLTFCFVLSTTVNVLSVIIN